MTPLQVVEGGQVKTMGLGRFVQIQEAALIFYRKGRALKPKPTDKVQQPPEMEAILALEMQTPMPGYPVIKETFFTVVRAVKPTKITVGAVSDTDMGFSADPLVNICNVASHEVSYGRGFMPTLGFANQMHYFPDHKGPTDPLKAGTDSNRNTLTSIIPKKFERHPSTQVGQYKRNQTVTYYPYVSNAFPVGNEKTFSFTGGEFEVEIWSGEAPASGSAGDPRARLIQTVTLKFPEKSQQLPVPEVVDGYLQANANKEYAFQKRLTGGQGDPWDFFNRGQELDVVRSIEYTGAAGTQAFKAQGNKGDLRLSAVRSKVPASFFEPRKNYTSTTIRLVHGLHVGHGDSLT
ncbi:MAG: hypothetical protein EOP84_35330, partial [Verrucomicrobiaceae bacterium]